MGALRNQYPLLFFIIYSKITVLDIRLFTIKSICFIITLKGIHIKISNIELPLLKRKWTVDFDNCEINTF